jgi:hypothetical protein|nr:MAG TPA: zinc-ribbon family protein [Caudoviricetes sp.]
MRRRCKKCNGDVEYCKMGRGSYSFIFFLIGGCMMWIPIIGWIGAPICFILAILMLLVPTHYFVRCVRCGEVTNITKEEYEEVMR